LAVGLQEIPATWRHHTTNITGLSTTPHSQCPMLVLLLPPRDQKNNIVQPAELKGVGECSLSALVVRSAVNILCANVNETEIAPLIYVTWPDASTSISKDNPNQELASAGYANNIQLLSGQFYLNSTAVDDIFEWGVKYGRQPPVFPMVSQILCTFSHLTLDSY
jgi:hypothetical protein